MSPQKENGYTAIANEIMDALIKHRLPGEQMQCLLFILRKTYGFNKKIDSISLSQFVESTGINRGNVARAIRGLSEKNFIFIEKGSIKKDTIKISKYRFNKHFEVWLSSVKKDTGSVNIDKKVVSKKTHTKDTITKYKKDNADSSESAPLKFDFYTTKSGKKLTGKRLESFNLFWDAFNFKHGKAAAADSWAKIPTLTNKILEDILTAAKIENERRPEILAKNGTPKWAQGWLTERRWEDEAYKTAIKEEEPKTPEQIQKEIAEALS